MKPLSNVLPKVNMSDYNVSTHMAVRRWLHKITPPVPFDCLTVVRLLPRNGLQRFRFEMSHTEMIKGRTEAWRTGTVSVWFDKSGVVVDVVWDVTWLNPDDKYFKTRPLWLHGQFWDYIPMSVKLLQPEYAPDPFDGSADFLPSVNVSSEGMEL